MNKSDGMKYAGIFIGETIATFIFVITVLTRKEVFEKAAVLIAMVYYGSIFGAGVLNPIVTIANLIFQRIKSGTNDTKLVNKGMALLMGEILGGVLAGSLLNPFGDADIVKNA
jgi:hypothetical protein